LHFGVESAHSKIVPISPKQSQRSDDAKSNYLPVIKSPQRTQPDVMPEQIKQGMTEVEKKIQEEKLDPEKPSDDISGYVTVVENGRTTYRRKQD
jgi:hypothetical protein